MIRGIRRLAVGALLVLLGCASSRTQAPPRVDLAEWGTIGIVGFDAGAEAGLSSLVTREFVQMLQDAQPGVRILELGSEQGVLSELGREELDLGAVRALGERYELDAVFAGNLVLGGVEPIVRLGKTFGSLRARADVTGELVTRLFETDSGATVWSRSATAPDSLAKLGVRESGMPTFDARKPSDVHADLVSELVQGLGSDFRPGPRER
jgi:hypothetical protein